MKRADKQPVETQMVLFGGIFAKAYTVPDADTVLPQHAHRSAHVTALTAGSVEVWADDRPIGVFHAPAFIKIDALVKHRFLTLTDDVGLMCIHALDVEDVPIHEEHHLVTEET
jgi:hypothetical protein